MQPRALIRVHRLQRQLAPLKPPAAATCKLSARQGASNSAQSDATLPPARATLNPAEFYQLLASHNIEFFCGVPDSLLADFASLVEDHAPRDRHVITPNEGNAIAAAAGYHLATRRTALVYLQNSGLGNAINPLLSLADPQVYAVPMLLLIGWRGEPGQHDEPQHMVQGAAYASDSVRSNTPLN